LNANNVPDSEAWTLSVNQDSARSLPISSAALVQLAEHMSGLAQPTARGGNLRGVASVLVVAVPAAAWRTTAVRAPMHPASPPANDRRRFAGRAGSCLGSAAIDL
jgi:hypothetical protein